MRAPPSDAMVVLHGGEVIGVHRLDSPTAGVAGAPLAQGKARQGKARQGKATLRAFAPDVAWQGRGLGSAALAACCADLVRRRPGRRVLLPTVHTGNAVARHL